MNLGVLTVPFAEQPLKEVLPYLQGLGIQTVELGTGGFTNKAHCDPAEYLHSPQKQKELKALLERYGLTISALSCHGNPVHPQKERAKAYHEEFVNTCHLAQELEVDTVVTFSGCPGGSQSDSYPNWVTCPWPEEFSKLLQYQWEDVLLPYWQGAAGVAKASGVRVAIEMHPGFCVYNPETMLRLHREVGPAVGANFDPSHLFWQGIDPAAAIRALGAAIYYVHAKDCAVDRLNMQKNGLMDTKHYSNALQRAWTFRTVGYGHPEQVWRGILSNLRMVGYDGTVSIEHEDALMSVQEGLERAVAFLNNIMIRQKPAQMWWA